nr:PREDICTED: protein D3-like [Bemisia tabaci]XP_018905902.1 PREDICTED: protein D3-like [Bemisia tabaci]XP_018905903.1 PREDICTED: protein D3-like [Bemisia tabaci]
MNELLDLLRVLILYKQFLVGCLIFLVYHLPFKSAQKLDASTIKDLEQKMKTQHFEEILGKPAEHLIELEWDHGKYEVKAGDEVDIEKVYKKPSKVTWDADLDYYYTLLLYDYDNLRGFVHWMIGDIPEKNLTAGTTFYDYYGPKLFEEGDVHRYVMVIYRQNGRTIRWAEPFVQRKTYALRAYFNQTEFQEQYSLGPPYAFTFFTSEVNKS